MRQNAGNITNYYKSGKSAKLMSYRKHVDWKVRQANIVTEGFDNDSSHGTISLPEPGECPHCDQIIMNGSDPQTIRLKKESG